MDELDAIIDKMITAGQSDADIQFVVGEWKRKGIGTPHPNDPSKLPTTPYTSEQFTPRSFGGLVSNAFEEGATLLNPTKWPGVIKGALQAKQAGDARLAAEMRQPLQPDAFQYPGDRLIQSLRMAPGVLATDAYEHPLSTAALLAPGVPAAYRGGRAATRAVVDATTRYPEVASAVVGGVVGGITHGPMGALQGVAGGGATGVAGRVAKAAYDWMKSKADTPTPAAAVPRAIDPMAAGMKAMGKEGARRFDDLVAAERLGTDMAKRAAAPPVGRVVPRTPPVTVEGELNTTLQELLRPESVDLPLSHPGGGGFTVSTRAQAPPGRLVPGSGPTLTQEIQDALVKAQTPPVTSVELPLSHPTGGGFTIPPGRIPPAPKAAAPPVSPVESQALRREPGYAPPKPKYDFIQQEITGRSGRVKESYPELGRQMQAAEQAGDTALVEQFRKARSAIEKTDLGELLRARKRELAGNPANASMIKLIDEALKVTRASSRQ